jgi:hypothetical protein
MIVFHLQVIDPRSFVVVPNSAERYPKRQRFEKMMWWRGERVTYVPRETYQLSS